MGIIESYSRATIATNLKDDEFHHATEKLAAVALSGRLGTMLFRVKYSNDASSYPRLSEEWTEVVKAKAVLRAWPNDVSPKKIARLSLEYWQNDVCTVCGGRGALPVAHVPNVLSDDACPACNGTAKRPIQAKHNLIKYVTDMVECIEEMTRHAGSEAIRKLADEFN